MPVTLENLSLRARERALLVGGTNTGKSTLGEALFADFHNRYPAGRLLILDSKPRFRAEQTAHGHTAKRRYRKWGHGAAVPGSVLVETPEELDIAWATGARVAIAQVGDDERGPDIRRLLATCRRFLNQSRANRPQLVVVDECMDFYSSNGQAAGGDDVLSRVARAGRERGTGLLVCTQRTRGIPAQLMEELTKLYLFRLDYHDDVKRLWEMGAPRGIEPPDQERVFLYWTKLAYRDVWGPYTLDLTRH